MFVINAFRLRVLCIIMCVLRYHTTHIDFFLCVYVRFLVKTRVKPIVIVHVFYFLHYLSCMITKQTQIFRILYHKIN